jgi:acyl-CoA thioester hydrolase
MVTAEVRVRYADTDAMGVVYHANYLVWFEVGRGELMRAWGLPYSDFEKRGIMVPVVEGHVRWVYPARYDDLLQVQTRVAEISPAKITFAYRIVRAEDGKLCCEGTTVHGFLGPNGRPAALPKLAPDLWEAFKAKVEAQGQ